jgi:hypothetical protein
VPDFPRARTSSLLVEELDGELMVYDQDADTAHVLRDDVARVWQLCDGTADADRIAADLRLDLTIVELALDELRTSDLLTADSADASALSRRDAVKKVAKVGAAAASVPLIYSLAIGPAAAMASATTCNVQPCEGTGLTALGIVNIIVGANAQCGGATPAAGCRTQSTCTITTITQINPPLGLTSHFTGHCTF